MQYAFFAFCYYYVKESLRHEKQLQRSESAKHEAEYAFLRTQINPHFLNNTLNLFYAKFLPLSDKLAECTLKLSQLMHYTLGTNNDNTRSLLEEELAHANQLIEINKLSSSKTALIKLEVNGNTENILIMPFVMITLLEYIFEYHASQASSTCVKLNVDINAESDTLTLSTRFEKGKLLSGNAYHSTLSGLKKRLFNHYSNRFDFNVMEDQTKSEIVIKLPLLFNKELKHLSSTSNLLLNS
jgi:LytS/YehU family sensor histidine kinase